MPTGYAHFAQEGFQSPHELMQSAFNLTHWTYFDKGGHFAAFQVPRDLAGDIIKFSRTLQ